MIKIIDKKMCCGCTACKNICPNKAIQMKEDNEGFLYPNVEVEKCSNCKLCEKVCPILNKNNFSDFKQEAYIFQNLDLDVRKDSTSGGFYTSIGEYVINREGIVYGASFSDDFKVIHSKAEKIEELKKFRKSKYVQSDLKDIFKEIKNYLNSDKLICFSGTPCQVAGLKSFLQKDYENLILVDIMCHSVPSPLFFEKYKKYILKKLKANRINEINFRDKSKYGYKYSVMTVNTDNGVYSEGMDTDPYLRAFFQDLSVRPSCYNCQFKTQKRISDFTIWDCKNISEIDKEFDDDIGTTRLLIHTEKGKKILNTLNNVKVEKINVDLAVKKVREMTNSVKNNEKREEFWKKIDDENLINEFFPTNLKTKLNSLCRKTLVKLGLYSKIVIILKKIIKR